MKFAGEGLRLIWPFAVGAAVIISLSILLHLRGLLTVGVSVLIFSLLVLMFFRDPERRPPSDPRAIVSPADGKIMVAPWVTQASTPNTMPKQW